MKNCITINTKKDNIVIKISDEARQEEIIECLKSKIDKLKKLYQDEKTPITVTGKILKNKDIDEIQKIIKNSIDVDIEFDSPRTLGLHGIKKTYSKDTSISETKFYRNALRSGQRIEFEGSIVILGDVNDGAEAIASDNIVILGALRGLAHAGAKGNKNASIAAISIETPQIRIANIVKEIEREEINQTKATFAYIEKDEIVLE